VIHTIFGKFRSNGILGRICAIFQAQNFLTLCFFLWTPHLIRQEVWRTLPVKTGRGKGEGTLCFFSFCHCEAFVENRNNLICYWSFQGLLHRLVPYKNRWDCFARLQRVRNDKRSKSGSQWRVVRPMRNFRLRWSYCG